MRIEFGERAGGGSPVAAYLRLALILGVVLLAFWLLGQVILLIFAAVLLATLLTVAAERVARWLRLGYGGALGVVVVALAGAAVVIGVALAPRVGQEMGNVMAALPGAVHSFIASIDRTALGHSLMQGLHGRGGVPLAGPVLNTVTSAATALGSIVFVLVMGIYFAAQPQLYERGLVRLVPHRRRARVREIVDTAGRALRYFLFGRLFSMAVIGLCSGLGLWALGVPSPVALGLIAAVLSFVPYVGSAASGIVPFLLAYMQSPLQGAYVVGLYVLIHLLDGYLLVPLVQRRMVHLPPALTLAAQVVLGTLFGLAGIAVATPLCAVLLVLVDMGYIQDVLDEPVVPPGAAEKTRC